MIKKAWLSDISGIPFLHLELEPRTAILVDLCLGGIGKAAFKADYPLTENSRIYINNKPVFKFDEKQLDDKINDFINDLFRDAKELVSHVSFELIRKFGTENIVEREISLVESVNNAKICLLENIESGLFYLTFKNQPLSSELLPYEYLSFKNIELAASYIDSISVCHLYEKLCINSIDSPISVDDNKAVLYNCIQQGGKPSKLNEDY